MLDVRGAVRLQSAFFLIDVLLVRRGVGVLRHRCVWWDSLWKLSA
jgi:hypothetical protein